MSCSYLISGDASVVASRRLSEVSFRQSLFLPRHLLQQPPIPSLSRCVRLVATVNDKFSKQSLGTRNCVPSLFSGDIGRSNGKNDNGDGGGGGGDGGWWFNGNGGGDNSDDDSFYSLRFLCFLVLVLSCFFHFRLSAASAIAKAEKSDSDDNTEKETVWEVRGSKRKRLVPDFVRDEFVSEESAFELSSFLTPENLLAQCRNLLTQFLLPEGFPNSVTSDYLDYSLWRGVQGIASQISGVLATQVERTEFINLS